MEIGPYQQSVLRSLGAGSFYAVLHPDWITNETVITSGVSGNRMTAIEVTQVYIDIADIPDDGQPVLIMYGVHTGIAFGYGNGRPYVGQQCIISTAIPFNLSKVHNLYIGCILYFATSTNSIQSNNSDGWFCDNSIMYAPIGVTASGTSSMWQQRYKTNSLIGVHASLGQLDDVKSQNDSTIPYQNLTSGNNASLGRGTLIEYTDPVNGDFSLKPTSKYNLINRTTVGRYGVGNRILANDINNIESITGLTISSNGIKLTNSTGPSEGTCVFKPIRFSTSTRGYLKGVGLSNLRSFCDNFGFGKSIVVRCYYKLLTGGSIIKDWTEISIEDMSNKSIPIADVIQVRLTVKRVK